MRAYLIGMATSDEYLRQCTELLEQAALTMESSERSRLIAEAAQWNLKAIEADKLEVEADAARKGDGRTVVAFPDEPEAPDEG